MIKLGSTVVFFGNGPVAAASLQGFIDSFGVDAIEAIVTKARPAHHKDTAPVEQLANTLGLTIWFASNKNELDELISAKQPKSPLGIVIDYGVVISGHTIDHFTKGIINSHFSLLPEWRGADPITYSLLSGQPKTGVSLMLINEGLDTGPLFATANYEINDTETIQSLTSNLVELSNITISRTLPAYVADGLITHNQPYWPTTYSRKLTKKDGELIFSKTATELEREVRAFNGWPKSRVTIAGLSCAVTKSTVNDKKLDIGQVFLSPEKTLLIGCRVGSLQILELQPAGKTRMPTASFLNGYGHLL